VALPCASVGAWVKPSPSVRRRPATATLAKPAGALKPARPATSAMCPCRDMATAGIQYERRAAGIEQRPRLQQRGRP
jgi:hypothetical protein